ncbi:MAG TPA: hypothetical protein DCY24_07620, partial [Rikenellaceae bacterium]|nr:hypothetical protein [Rikenellaceae bacterium]
NRNGQKPESLKTEPEPTGPQFVSAVGDDSITRFDKPKKNKNKNKNRSNASRKNGNGRPPRQRGDRKPEQNPKTDA